MGLVLYEARGLIGAELARAYLKGKGVPAAIAVERLTTSGFTGRATLGDPRDPDLVVDRIEVEFEPAPLFRNGLVAPRLRSIRLVRPRLKARYDGQKLTFGSLQRLVDEAAREPATGPGPTVNVEGGVLKLSTPAGALSLVGDARLDQGRLARLSARLQPARLRQGRLGAEITGAALQAHAEGAMIVAALSLSAPRVAQGAQSVRGLHADISAALPYNQALSLDGTIRLVGSARAADLSGGTARLTAPLLSFSLQGQGSGTVDRLGFAGSAAFALSADQAATPASGNLKAPALTANVSHLLLDRRPERTHLTFDADLSGSSSQGSFGASSATVGRFSAHLASVDAAFGPAGGLISAAPRLLLTASRVGASGIDARDLSADLASTRMEATWSDGGWSLEAPVQLHARGGRIVAPLQGGKASVHGVSLDLAGKGRVHSAGTELDLQGGLHSTGGGVSAGLGRSLAGTIPIVGTDPAGRAAIERALGVIRVSAPAVRVRAKDGAFTLSLPRPAEASSPGGAHATLSAPASLISPSGGGFALKVAGGGVPDLDLVVPAYRLGQDGGGFTFSADPRLALGFSGQAMGGASLKASFHATRSQGAIDVALHDCADLAATSFGEGPDPLLRNLRAFACAEPGLPVLSLRSSAWRLQAALKDVGFDAPASQAAVREGRASAELAGAGDAPPTGKVEITGARLTDAAPMKRFEPLSITGRIDLARGVWSGPMALAEAAKGRPVAQVRISHRMDDAVGHADISVPTLAFAKDGLQPKDLTPVGADMISDAEGSISFSGVADWKPGALLVSSGRLTMAGMDLRSPAGPVKQARTEMTFTSLAPLISAPGQIVSAQSVAALVPLDAPTATLALKEDRISLASASTAVAGGHVSLEAMELPFAPDAVLTGVISLDQVDLSALIAQFNLAEKVSLQAKVDGRLPFTFSPEGLRFTDGRIFATGPGRLTIQRDALTGTTAAGAAPGVQDFAYQALQDLAFDKLEAEIASQPMGRLGILFRINGRHDPPVEGRTRVALLDLLRGQAFNKPIDLPKGTPVNLTLDTSLNFDELLAAYSGRGRSEPVQSAPPNQ